MVSPGASAPAISSWYRVVSLPRHVAFSAMGTALASVESVAGLGENSLSDVLCLAAANHVLRIPLLDVIGEPGLAAVMAISAAKHVI